MKRIILLMLNLGLGIHAQTTNSLVRNAVEKALPALQQAGPVFAKKTGCISCHHQTLPARVTAMASERGYNYDRKLEADTTRAILGIIQPAREVLIEGSDVVPQLPASGGHMLMALAAQHYPADATTAAIVHGIGLRQRPDGSWTGWAQRAPISGGDIRETVAGLRGLDLYAPPGRRAEFNSRIVRARQWLVNAKPATPEESIARLQGLVWAHADDRDVNAAAKAVIAMQRVDGGWAQLDSRESDAFATGEALLALYGSGAVQRADSTYRRGVEYLLRTQAADGSWHVKTRAYPFQPLIDTGYPHGRDQWISAAGTSYALMALMVGEN
ncbi:MAG: prenyltransferase/squalene oxidase repeat-containing protein [Bryobacteraceae bacterium]